MTTTAQQLAEVDRKLRTLRHGPEPRLAARRIMALLDERDRLRGALPRTRILRRDRCRLRDAQGNDKSGGKR